MSSLSSMKMTWGFIGLGQMGYPMARNLRSKMPRADPLFVLDINQATLDKFVEETRQDAASAGVEEGARQVQVAKNAREVAEKADIIITCLPTVKVVKDTFASMIKEGSLPSRKHNRCFIDCSTIDPPSSRELAKSVRETLESRFVDAPVSGGAVGAQAGKLSFMFGTDVDSEGLVDYLKSVLLLMGTKAWHMGAQGCGVSAKLANNYILAINNIAVSEALNMGREWGLDLHKLTELINSSTGHCWPVEVNNPVPGVVQGSPASKGYTPGCPVSMINKDLGLAMSGAADAKIPLLLAEAAREAYNKVDGEYQGQDFSVVYQYLSRRSSA